MSRFKTSLRQSISKHLENEKPAVRLHPETDPWANYFSRLLNWAYKEQYSATSLMTALAAPSRSSKRCSSIGITAFISLVSPRQSLDEPWFDLKTAALKMLTAPSMTSSSTERSYEENRVSVTKLKQFLLPEDQRLLQKKIRNLKPF